MTFPIRFNGHKILRAVRRLNLLQGHLTRAHGELIEQGLDIDLVRENAGPLAVLLGVFVLNGLNKFFVEAQVTLFIVGAEVSSIFFFELIIILLEFLKGRINLALVCASQVDDERAVSRGRYVSEVGPEFFLLHFN